MGKRQLQITIDCGGGHFGNSPARGNYCSRCYVGMLRTGSTVVVAVEYLRGRIKLLMLAAGMRTKRSSARIIITVQKCIGGVVGGEVSGG